MSVRCGQRKISGSAQAIFSYYLEQSMIDQSNSAQAILGYHGIAQEGIVFDNVGGKAAAHLPGLDLSRGITKEQFIAIHDGSWDGVQLTKGGYAPVPLRDANGAKISVQDPATGKWVKQYEMEVRTKKVYENGVWVKKPVLDPLTGEPEMKRVMVKAEIDAHDLSFNMDKSAAEFLIAHPEHTQLFKRLFLEAVNTTMRVEVEGNTKLVAKTIKRPSEVLGRTTKTQGSLTELVKAEGLLWTVVFGNSARPTPESLARGYGADSHVHAHVYLPSLAYMGEGKWQKIDGANLWRQAEQRSQLCSTIFNRLLEDEGIHIRYSDPDLKGRIHSEIEGSNVDARMFFSTNSKRAWDLQMAFEREHGKPPTAEQLNHLMHATKGEKTREAKVADEMGNLEQARKWRKALDNAGIELTITDVQPPVERASLDERLDTLFARLELPSGVARDIQSAAVFGPEVILPAVYRASEGLGLDSEQLALVADTYRETRLERRVDPRDLSRELYTTQTILDGEREIAGRFAEMAAKPVPEVPIGILASSLYGQDVQLNDEQEELVRAICGSSQLVHGIGRAGSGKSRAMAPAVDALRRSGLVNEVVVVSLAKRTAVATGESVKADLSLSMAGLKLAAENGWKPTKKTLVIADEAAMLSTFDASALVNILGDARLVTIGDSKQAPAIGAAGWYAHELEARPPVELKTVYRQTDEEDRVALDLIRHGDAPGALDNLVARGRVHAVDDSGELVKLVRERWEHHRAAGRELADIAVVVTGSNRTLDDYNRAIQRSRIDHGEVDETQAFTVSESSTGRRSTIYAGDEVIFAKGEYFGLDEPVLNGTTAKVLAVDSDGRCRLELHQDDRRTLTINLKAEAETQTLVPAYAIQTMRLQGGETPVCLVVPGSPNTASLNSGYSAASRTQDHVEILLSRADWGEYPVVRLGQAWSEEATKQQASEYLELLDEPVDSIYEDLGEVTEYGQACLRIQELRNELSGQDHGWHM